MKLRELKPGALERAEVTRIAQELTAAGWAVWPDFEVSPTNGKPARVDIMARKGKAVRLIEVKSKGPLRARDDARLLELQQIAQANGWQFELREIADPVEKSREITERIGPQLARLKESLAALDGSPSPPVAEALRVYVIVLGTDILDALIRSKMAELALAPERHTSSFLAAGVLAQHGAISPATYHLLNRLRAMRNEALHPSIKPDSGTVAAGHAQVVRLVTELLSQFGVSL